LFFNQYKPVLEDKDQASAFFVKEEKKGGLRAQINAKLEQNIGIKRRGGLRSNSKNMNGSFHSQRSNHSVARRASMAGGSQVDFLPKRA